jgi:RNA polymerase sigma factor (sigma-70 family)
MEHNSPPVEILGVETRLDPESDFDLLTDVELCDLVRSNNSDAFAELFTRYRYSAARLARYYSASVDADDVVSEVFSQVLNQLQRGRGPHDAVRAYIFTAVRRETWKRVRALKRVVPTDNLALIDEPVPFGGGGIDSFERDRVRAAFLSLPQRWRNVLWYLEVEGRKPRELAGMLGLKPNSVSALLYRARAGLRKAYESQQQGPEARDPMTGLNGTTQPSVESEASEPSEPTVTITNPRVGRNVGRLEDAHASP